MKKQISFFYIQILYSCIS